MEKKIAFVDYKDTACSYLVREHQDQILHYPTYLDVNLMEDINMIREQGNSSYIKIDKKVSERGVWVDVRTQEKIGRNEPCACGSGKKYKKCCQ